MAGDSLRPGAVIRASIKTVVRPLLRPLLRVPYYVLSLKTIPSGDLVLNNRA